MKMEKVKSDKQIPVGLKVIKVDSSIVENSIKRLSLTFEDGRMLECAYRSYDMEVVVTAPPVMKKVWRVEGTLFGVKFAKDFENERCSLPFRDKMRDVGALVGEPQMLELPEDEVQLADDEDLF